MENLKILSGVCRKSIGHGCWRNRKKLDYTFQARGETDPEVYVLLATLKLKNGSNICCCIWWGLILPILNQRFHCWWIAYSISFFMSFTDWWRPFKPSKHQRMTQFNGMWVVLRKGLMDFVTLSMRSKPYSCLALLSRTDVDFNYLLVPNTHLLVHLPQQLVDHGPFFATWCFFGERFINVGAQ